ncbi:peptidoglycan-binding protein [Micromonospora sp. NPDC023956]|uniref:peptidoglycan-binding domain-containing protein n=1 Tax=Micromonospora sp. NPDC023956 TaxID=3155722 RepID=UPI0033DDB27A
MTSAPACLKEARAVLLEALDIHENTTAYPTDLDPVEVGIVGDSAHRGGYHCGADRVVSGDYSVVESSRDRAGLTDYASALDIGQFSYRDALGRVHNLRTFSVWLVGECTRGAADCADIREVIYSPDGKVVKRWDRLRKRSSGDSSHLWHTHISFFRDAVKAGRDLAAVFRRYLAMIGLAGTPPTPTPKPPAAPALPVYTLGSRVLKRGHRGTDVKAAQDLLRLRGRKIAADGDFGPATEAATKDFQRARWLEADGLIGPDTLGALRTNLGVRVMRRGDRGTDVKELQRLLNARGARLALDGDFGPATQAAVRTYQRSARLAVDGIAGRQTVTALRK